MKEAGGNFVRWGHCAARTGADRGRRPARASSPISPVVDGESDTRRRGVEAPRRRLPRHDHLLPQQSVDPDLGRRQPEGHRASTPRNCAAMWTNTIRTAAAPMRIAAPTKSLPNSWTSASAPKAAAKSQDLPVVEGEYDREESPRRVWDDFSPPNFGYPEAKGQTYQLTSEQFAVNQVAQYVKKLGAANHCGGANWIFSDSTSGGRVAVEVARASGEVDGVRLPKEAYYVCQAMFRADPQVHIIGHWTYPAGTKKTVYVAANGDEVELFVNGKSLGRGKVSNRYLFTFPDVAWEPGEIKAVAYIKGKPVAD